MNVRMLGHFVCLNVHNSEVNSSVIVKDISYTGRFNEQDFFLKNGMRPVYLCNVCSKSKHFRGLYFFTVNIVSVDAMTLT